MSTDQNKSSKEDH